MKVGYNNPESLNNLTISIIVTQVNLVKPFYVHITIKCLLSTES